MRQPLLVILGNIIELLVGAGLAYYDVRIALIYLMLFVLILMNRQSANLVRVYRVLDFSAATKLVAIMDKLDISVQDIQAAMDKQKEVASAEEWKSLQEDWNATVPRFTRWS